MSMPGTIISYDPRDKSGTIERIGDLKKFEFNSKDVSDKNLVIRINKQILFNAYNDESCGKTVAVRVRNNGDVKLNESDEYIGRVKWYNSLKGVGFVTCDDFKPFDAILYDKIIQRMNATHQIKPGTRLTVQCKGSKQRAEVIHFKITEKVSDNNLTSSSKYFAKPEPSQQTSNTVLKPININSNVKIITKPITVTIPVKHPHLTDMEARLTKQKSILQGIDCSKLPDKGKRLQDNISCLEAQINQMTLHSTKQHSVIVHQVKNEHSETSNSFKFNVATKPPLAIKREPIQVIPAMPMVEKPRIPTLPSNSIGSKMQSKLIAIRSLTIEAIEDFHKSLETAPSSTDELEDPNNLLVTLMKHQRQALAWLVWREGQKVSGGVLADDMGLGKTLTMISLIMKQREIGRKNKIDKAVEKENSSTDSEVSKTDSKNTDLDLIASEATLIVAPASLIHHWKLEINNRCKNGLLAVNMFHGNKREIVPRKLATYDVVITTYDIVRLNFKDPNAKAKISKGGESSLFEILWRRVILDEAHQIKNHNTQISKAACALHAKSRWALSGTPVQNALNDLYSLIKFLHCSPFDDFRIWTSQVSKHSKSTMRSKMLVSGLVLRREKSQKDELGKPIINLPPKNYKIHKIKLSDVEQKVYTKLQNDARLLLSQDEKMGVTAMLVMLLRLRQCCCHLNLLQSTFDTSALEEEKEQVNLEDCFNMLSLSSKEKGEDVKKNSDYSDKSNAKHFEVSKRSGKIEFVMDELQRLGTERPDDKVVIISEWTGLLDIMAHHLEKERISYATIKGGIAASKRMEHVQEFNTNPRRPKVMLISLKAGGVGLNLIGGNHLFLLNMHWNPALERQAFDRIYRVGQKKEVFIHKFVVEGTIEDRMVKLQENKLSIAQSVLDGADAENKMKLTLKDMRLLFGV